MLKTKNEITKKEAISRFFNNDKELYKELKPSKKEIKNLELFKMKSFVVKSKDLFNKKKNPKLSLSVEDILKNKKINKIAFEYNCPDCGRGIIRTTKIKNKHTKINGKLFI